MSKIWDEAMEAAAQVAEMNHADNVAEQVRAMKGRRATIMRAMQQDEADQLAAIERAMFQNVETGMMIDNGNGTFSLSDKGKAHVESLLGRTL